MKVTLTSYEIFLAAMVGVRRKIASNDYSKASTFIDPQVWWGSDIESACAEMAVAKALKIYWDGSVNTYSAPDVGVFQVRHTPILHGKLIIRPKDSDAETFIFIVGSSPDFEIIGYMTGKEAKQDKYLSDPHGKAPCWMVPQGELTPSFML
jgi:hypothetical protein